MWMEEKLKALYGQITKSEKVAFLSTFIGGLLAHLYCYTNTIPNFDGLSRVYDEQQMTISGRWFLHYASSLNYYTQMPMVIGILSMLFLGISCLLIVRMFRIKSSLMAGIWGVLYAVFPAVAYTNSYTFTMSAYCFSVVLAVLAIYVTRNKKWGFIAGVILLAFSMGIYQTYVAIAIVLSVLLILQDALLEESKVKDILATSGRHILTLGLGTALYYGILKLFLYVKDLELCSYLGMNEVEAGYPIGELGTTIAKTYKQVGSFFFAGDHGLENKLFLIVNILVVLVAVLLLVCLIKEGKIYKNIVKILGILALLMLIPMSVNFTQIISPLSEPRLIMKAAFVFVYFVPVMLLNQVEWNAVKRTVKELAAVVMAVSLLAVSVYFWEYDNLLYTMLNHAHRATQSFVTNVVTKVESCEGYEMGMPVVVVGGFPSERYDTDILAFQYVNHGGAFSSSVIPLNKHIYYYMNDWLNVPIQEPTEELYLQITATEAFQQMPLYPNDGSIQVIDGCVVVKMKANYTPKSQLEKEYENRR